MRGLLAALLAAALVFAASAGAAKAPVVLGSRDSKLQPSGAAIRLVVSKATVHRRVTVLLTLYRRVGHIGYGRIKQIVVARRLPKSGKLKALLVNPRGHNTASVHVAWRLSRHTLRAYRFSATATRLVRR